jgi:hypothetical protein
MAETFDTFEDFWDHYVRAHANKRTRDLHFVGTTAALGLAAGGILLRKGWMILLAPVVGYGFAWAGHFLVEGNRPATFSNPLWSFRADLRMWELIRHGKMDAEVDRIVRQHEARTHEEAEAAASEAERNYN